MTGQRRGGSAMFEALRNHFDHEHFVGLMLIIIFYNGEK